MALDGMTLVPHVPLVRTTTYCRVDKIRLPFIALNMIDNNAVKEHTIVTSKTVSVLVATIAMLEYMGIPAMIRVATPFINYQGP